MKKIEKGIIFLLIVMNLMLLYKHYSYHRQEENDILVWSDKKLTSEYKIEELSNEHQNKIRIYYPKTDYELLNKKIKEEILTRKENFEKSLEDSKVQPNQYYTFFINYDSYETNSILSYVFYVEEYTGGAHPSTIIFTISFDIKNESFLTIDTLIQKDSNLLNTLSEKVRKQLSANEPFSSNKDIYQMMIEGTKPKKDNFKNLAFSKEGLIIFFEQYQIAPYSEGMFQITIPYGEIPPI